MVRYGARSRKVSGAGEWREAGTKWRRWRHSCDAQSTLAQHAPSKWQACDPCVMRVGICGANPGSESRERIPGANPGSNILTWEDRMSYVRIPLRYLALLGAVTASLGLLPAEVEAHALHGLDAAVDLVHPEVSRAFPPTDSGNFEARPAPSLDATETITGCATVPVADIGPCRSAVSGAILAGGACVGAAIVFKASLAGGPLAFLGGYALSRSVCVASLLVIDDAVQTCRSGGGLQDSGSELQRLRSEAEATITEIDALYEQAMLDS